MPIGFNHNTQNINQSEEIVLQTGAIFGSARSSAPTGYLTCDGSAVSRSTYSNLFSAIGTTYGVGDGSTTFNLPDLRGVVPRGVGTSTGYTANVTVTLGTKQNDQMQGHYHNLSGAFFAPDAASSSVYTVGYSGSYGAPYIYVQSPSTDNTNGTPRTGTETRMKNVGVNFFIKF